MKETAHGVIAGLCFAVLFPLGAIVLRIFSFNGLIWVHAGIQVLTQILFIVAFGLGVSITQDIKTLSGGHVNYITKYHPIIGIVVFALVLAQPVLGHMHHTAFMRTGGRTAWSHAHMWIGRLIITLGIINGGLGFLLAQNTSVGPIAYAIVAAIFYIIYVVSAFVAERRKARARTGRPPKYQESAGSGNWSGGPTSPQGFYGRNIELQNRREGM